MKIQENISLKEFTTFKIGGNARFFCVVSSKDELIDAISFSKKNKTPFFILGGGSNILVSDEGFPGLVIKIEIKGIEYKEDSDSNIVRVVAWAGENWDDFVSDTINHNLYGLENLSNIPGTVGASPVQNIGAYGAEVKDTIESVEVLDIKDDEYKILNNFECKFDYRDSIFKKEENRYVVLSVVFLLNKKRKLSIEYKDLKEYFEIRKIKEPTLLQVRNAIINIRSEKLPNLSAYGTAGSFFKNVVVSVSRAKELASKYPDIILYPINDKKVKVSLAWILDGICGFRGVRRGSVGVYKNQALVLINYGNGTAKEITDLAQDMVDKVYLKTGIEIIPEVQFIV